MGAKCECREYEEPAFPVVKMSEQKLLYGKETSNSTNPSSPTVTNRLAMPALDSSKA